MADATRRYEELIDAARLASNRGDRGEAERLLIEALVTGERSFGADHLSLGTALNELGRLYIRQSQHALAEEVLERLLRITRAKGDSHPDVATALTGLALVKRALGDHAAAEEQFREALRIREQALAPEHMATVVTMEQLSESCASRGNVAEAITLLQRALRTREAALGAEHATVRSLRTRIAELELRVLAATLASSEPKVELEASTERTAAASSPSSPADMAAPATEPMHEASVVSDHTEPARRPLRKRFALFASVGLAAITLVTAGMAARSRADASDDHASASTATVVRPAASGPAVVASAIDSMATLSDSGSAMGIVQAGTPMSDSAPRTAAPRLPITPKNLAAVTALVGGPNADSLVRASARLDRGLSGDSIGAGITAAPR